LLEILGKQIGSGSDLNIPCPLCRRTRGTMRVYRDVRNGGYWWCCDRCRVGLHTFRLYQRCFDVPDVRSAWQSLVRRAGLSPPAHLMGEDAVVAQEDRSARDDRLGAFWEASRRLLRQAMPRRSSDTLRAMGLWGGFDAAFWDLELGQYVGCSNKLLLETAPINRIGMEKGWNDSLVLGYEHLPGRVGTFLFIRADKALAKYTDNKDAGLLGLGQTPRFDRPLFCIDDPTLFLHLQRRWLRDHPDPMPLLCTVAEPDGQAFRYGRTSATSWSSVRQDVIFWSPSLSPALFDQARMLGVTRGRIAKRPDVRRYANGPLLEQITVPELVRIWEKDAKPWPKALADHALSLGVPDATRFLGRLEPRLSQSEVKAIEQACSVEQYRRLRACFSPAPALHTFVCDDEQYAERPATGWARIKPVVRPGELMEFPVSDAYFELHLAAAVGEEVHFSGEVHHQGHSIAFTASEQTIAKDPAGWLSAMCVSRELPMPVIADPYRNRLLRLALASHPPLSVGGMTRCGWDSQAHAFTFPQATVRQGEILPRPVGRCVNGQALPGVTLRALDGPPGDLSGWALTDPTIACGWALLACITSNLLRRRAGRDPAGIVLVERLGLAGDLLGKFGEQIGLVAVRVRANPNERELEALQAAEKAHDLPALLRGDRIAGYSWFSWARSGNPHNIVMAATNPVATNLAVTGAWYLIGAGGEPTEIDRLNGMSDLLIPALAMLPDQPLMPREVLTEFASWLGPEVGPALDEARRKIREPGPMWERFLAVLFSALRSGHLEQGLIGADKPSGLMRDATRAKIVLDWRVLERQLTGHGWFLPAADVLDNSFRQQGAQAVETDAGWELEETFWNLAYARWEQTL
jgi:hypothetical protein